MNRAVDSLLLLRSGRVTLHGSPAATRVPQRWLRALDLELAALGFVLSHRARAAIGQLDDDALAETHTWLTTTLAASLGATQKHEPLFRLFPKGVPEDTRELWFKKFVGFYFQTADQPCLWCDGGGTTHVLQPCLHVVCDRCFDGANYSACPVCERAVDRDSPFFVPAPEPGVASTNVALRKLDLAGPDEPRRLFAALCARPQAMSPDDVTALTTLVGAFGVDVLAWLPEKVPVRENVAHIVGTLLRSLPAAEVIPAVGAHLKTATDLLRAIAVWSDAGAALQATPKRLRPTAETVRRWSGKPRLIATEGESTLAASVLDLVRRYPAYRDHYLSVELQVRRFKVRKMSRATRRVLLAWLDARPEEALLEDIARHRSAWVGVGEVLHPGEYATRYPRAKRAFDVARGDVEGVSYGARVDRLRGDTAALAALLRTRPGELWRRADAELRRAADPQPLVDALVDTIGAVALPLLLTQSTQLGLRGAPWPVRVYFPKGEQFKAPSAPDVRPPLPLEITERLVAAIDAELVLRFGRLPRVGTAVIDAAIADIPVPFNERTAARASVVLPRGASVELPEGERLRLFLHWCQPARGGDTDIDLSIGFYDDDWAYTGVVSFSELNLGEVAVHSGDRRDAPHPDGASEFVDLDRAAALAAGHRYAVMVVNAYAGLPFSALDRAFAGVMRRIGTEGPAFDARSVALKFDVTGPNGIYAPLVVDLRAGRLWWLDVSSKGELALNTVATSNTALQRIVPAILSYFGLGVRPSMFELATLHAAARADEVWIRGAHTQRFVRRPEEPVAEFLTRLRCGVEDGRGELPTFEAPVFAALLHGDVVLPEGSTAWALFREQLTGVVSASDLLALP